MESLIQSVLQFSETVLTVLFGIPLPLHSNDRDGIICHDTFHAAANSYIFKSGHDFAPSVKMSLWRVIFNIFPALYSLINRFFRICRNRPIVADPHCSFNPVLRTQYLQPSC